MKRIPWLAGLMALFLLAGWLVLGREVARERGSEGRQEGEQSVAKVPEVALAPPAIGEHEEPMAAAAREPALQALGDVDAGERRELDFVVTGGNSELSVSGRVVDESGVPVDAFMIVARPDSWSSRGALRVPRGQGFREARGAFTLEGLDEGPWTLTATSEEFADSEGVNVAVPDAVPVTLVLRSPASLSGTVTDPSGEPVADAQVKLERVLTTREHYFSQEGKNAITDVQGRFTIERAAPGWATLTASKGGFAPSAPERLELVPSRESAGHLLQLQRGGTITGEIATGLGSPAGRSVTAEGAHAQYDAETDSEGRFSFADLPAGHFYVHAETEVGLELQTEVELPAGGTVHVRLATESTAFVRLFGRITVGDEAGRQYGIRAVLPDDSARGSIGVTDSEGNYALTLAGPGRYLLWVDWGARFAALWGGMIDVPSAREHRLDLAIPVAKIHGRVTSFAGEPVPGIFLRATSASEDSENQSHTTTDSDGRYELSVTAEPLVLVAAGDGVGRDSLWLPARRDLTVAPGETRAGIDFVLRRGGTLAVHVKNADGSSASDVTLWERGNAGWTGDRIAGTFTFDSLSPGRHVFGAAGKDRASPCVAVDVVAGETTTLELVLAPAVWVKVTFPGLPEASERLVVTLLEGGEQLPFASSGEGRAFLGPLIAGSYVVRARCGSLAGERVLEIRGDEGMLELEIALE